MSLSSRTYLKRIIHAFSTRTRVGVLALIVLVSSWFVAQLVLADRESNIYIFPSAVSSEGWGNDVQALAQDLSLDAELADFTTENSAYIFFGSVASTTEVVVVPETLSEVPSSEPTVSPIPSVVPQTTPITPESLPAAADVVTSTNGGGEIPTETPAATPLDIPNPLLPTMTTPEVLASSSAQSARPTGSFGTWIAEAVLGRAALVLAQDVPETSEADPVAPDATPSTSEETASTSASSSEVALSAPSPVSNDPYTVASCVTEGSPCHLMTFVGFGLGSALDTQPLLAATLQLSVAGRGTFSGDVHDRFIVRAYHDGRWEFLGETSVKGEFSNAKRGGYLSYALPDVATWSDLSDLRVVVEYVRQEGDGEESDASVVLDGVWVNAQYSSDTLSGVGADELALSGTNLRSALVAKDAALRDRDRDILTTPEGEVRTLVHGNEHPDATLVIKTDRETYHALGKTSTYFNVTNTDTEAQVVRLQFHLPTAADGAPGARITKLARFSQNVPYKVSSLKYDAVGYFCNTAWEPVSAEADADLAGKYTCAESAEVRSCPSFNEDKTNCIEDAARVGLTEDVEYRDGWTTLVIKDGSFRDDVGLFRKAIDLMVNDLPGDAIPSSEDPVAFAEESLLLESGQTLYFRADMEVPLNGRGDLYVEAAAESGAFGLVHTSWDGSWNYRVPVLIDNGDAETDGAYAVPVALDTLPASFWEHVSPSAADLRFVSGDGYEELPYWIASWDHAAASGLVWVRIPEMGQGTTTKIYVYGGDFNASSNSDPAAPFRTELLTPRGVVFGKSQQDMTVHVIALAEDVQVSVGGQEAVSLARGESALFRSIAPGMQVLANGPVVASVETPDGNASIVPTGFSGTHFLIPGIGGEGMLSIGTTGVNETHAEVRSGDAVTAIDPVTGSLVGMPVDLSTTHRLDADLPIVTTLALSEVSPLAPLYPSTVSPLYGFTVGLPVAGFGENTSALAARCAESGALQEIDGRREGSSFRLDRCATGIPALADAVVVERINHPASVVASDGAQIQSFLPESEFATRYVLTEDATRVLVLCTPAASEEAIGLFDPQGSLVASSTCSGYGPRPGKVIFEATDVFALGSEVRTLKAFDLPFLAGVEGVPAVLSEATHPFSLLFGAPLSRGIAPATPFAQFGEEEFVLPGEHRLLDTDQNGKEKEHVDELLSEKREFSVHETPGFHFRYIPRSNSFMQGVRDAFGIKPFTVNTVSLQHVALGDLPVEYDISYKENNEWALALKRPAGELRPGKYILRIEIEEGGETYVDEFDFFWGVLAINYQQSVFTPGETAQISIAALSDNGNTICNAALKLWITPPGGTEAEVVTTPSGKCDGNNVVDVPDYTATYEFPLLSATGTYQVKLVRFDGNENVASQIMDSVKVVEGVPLVVEREGPTRIYPVAHYPMRIKVTAKEDFAGTFAERLPGDFVVIDRGGADLDWGDDAHTFMTATWAVDMKAGQSVSFSYVFDAPDRSPYLYFLGPAKMEGSLSFTEERTWQIASDAVGQTYIYWDQTFIPAGWNCVSCTSGQTFYQKFAQGSSTYNAGLGGGSATDTPTFTTTVYSTGATGVGPATTNNTTNAKLSHAHPLTPTISGATNLPTYRQLVVLQWGSAGEPATLPTGAIVAFDVASSSLPSGWNRYTLTDGRYIRGMSTSTIGTTGGANTNRQSFTGTLTAAPDTGLRTNGTSGTSATRVHTHTLSATSTNTQNTEPPYVEVLFAKLTATATPPNTMIGMWDNTPPSGWVTLSNPGGVFDGKFMKASTTYGGTGGAVFHTYNDIIGATTSLPSATSNYNTNASNAQAPGNHTHTVDFTGFSTDDTRPPYVDIIFAKRFVNVVFWTQNNFRFYTNESGNTPGDPWPLGGSDIGENSGIDSSTRVMQPGDEVRLRMNLIVENATATPGVQAFKMQYVASTDCVNALNWSDVAAAGSSTALWRGFDNSGIADGVALSTTTLVESNVAQSYVEANNSPSVVATTTIGQMAEWDWVLEDHLADAGTNYCFRMVKSDGTPLDQYVNYPQVLTNSAPNAGTLMTPFDNEKVVSRYPLFTFVSSDAEGEDLDYAIQVSVSPSFSSFAINEDSSVDPGLFVNLSQTDLNYFPTGDTVGFTPTTPLASSTTYWWRVRAKDASGSNAWGSWSASRSFTVDTTVAASTWFQTTRDQFLTDTLSSATTTGGDDVQLTSASPGSVYSAPIAFSSATIGTAWGRMSWNSNQSNGNIKYQVEYQDQTTGLWALVPDADLPGNASAFGGAVSSTSLLSLDASVYDTIRLRANLTDIGGTPMHLDWTLTWGYKVTTPDVSSPFDNAKSATTTPTFTFSSSDPQGNNLVYQVSWSTTPTFTASTTRTSDVHGGFTNVTTSTSTSPFISGDVIDFKVQSGDALINGTTYYYRIRARVPSSADWSFWSSVRSLTVDTSITTATWYQTDNGQFLTDTFTSIRTVSTGSTTVATSTDEAMFAYGEGTVQTPRYRLWSGTAWGTEQDALSIGATLKWAILRASSVYGEYILATMGSDRDVNLQTYNNGVWGSMYKITGTSPSVTRRSFDVAYETISGRALAVACTGTADPTYAIWSATSSSWVATGTINLAFTSDCEWIRMASHPKTNELVMVARDTGTNYEAQVWNATSSTWGTSTGLFGSMTEVGHEGMVVEYENSGDQAVVAVGRGNNSGVTWRAWRSSTATWSAAANQTLNDDFENGSLHRDPNSDNMILCGVTQTPRVGVLRWTTAGWAAYTDLSTVALTKNDRPVDCAFESTAGRSGYIQTSYGDTTGTRYRVWTGAAWQAQANITGLSTLLTYTNQLERTSFSGRILGIFFVPGASSYYESQWATSSWTTATALENNASVTSAPYGQPFYLAPKNPARQGTIVSTPIEFADGNAPAWDTVTWSSSTPSGSTLRIQVQYYDSASSTWQLIPNTDLAGNSTGFTASINIKPLNTDTYHTIRLVANFSCLLTACPVLNEWTVKWAQGLNISGTAKQHDLITNVTGGTVAVAVNGVLQVGKTTTISGGVWTISNVTIFPGNTVEVFTSGGATSTRAIGIVNYEGPGDLGGLALNEHWVTIGSASTSATAVSLTNLSKYDNSVSGSNDIFFDVDNTTGNYNHCATTLCSDSSIYVLAGNTFQPATSSTKIISTFDFRLAGTFALNTNTLKVGASWRNLGGFAPGTGSVVFNATTSARTIDSTGAATSTFGNVTFGEAATGATWTFATPFVATGTVAMNYGTTTPGSQMMTLQGDLSIGVSGTFLKGSATTTFSGSGSNTWTDLSAAKQDLGNITINGSTKTITLGSSVKATHVHIASGNWLNAGGSHTFNVLGSWDNYGVFVPQSSTVNFATTTAGMKINQGTSTFYNLSFAGVGGSWSWQNTNATTTNDLTITSGTTTLPGGTLFIGKSFLNNGGAFAHNSGTVRMYATLTGNSIRVGGSPFFDLVFDGSGGAWSFLDTNATTSNTLSILSGTPTFPSGVLEVGRDFVNSGGTFVANGGTLKMTSALNSRTVTLGGSSLSNLLVQNAGVFTLTDTNATALGDVVFNAGTTTLPSGTFTIGGSFSNAAVFVPGSGTVTFNTSSGTRTVAPGNTSFANVTISTTGGTLTFSGNATTTANFTIAAATNFALATGKTLAVSGVFLNQVGGGATTWTGSTLALNSGTNYAINARTTGGDGYGTLRLGNNTAIRSWNSSSTAYLMGTGASLYSQNHNATSGALNIYGTYVRSSGTDCWDYATDFDCTSPVSRPVSVRFDAGATASFGAGTTVEMIGSATGSTSIDRIASGNYGITLTDATLNATYYQIRNMNASGLNLAGANTITALGNGDYSLDVNGGSSITVAAATIEANPAIQIFGVKFATSSGIASGYNVTEVGDPLSYWRFKDHYGNFAGESHDNDPELPTGNPGYIRWDDSSFNISITGTVYADAGVTPLGGPTCDNVTPVVRVKVDGGGTYSSPCLAANGAYAVTGISFSGDTVMTVYLDTNGGARAALVTRSAAGDLSGMNLYRDRVIVRHEDVFPMTIAKMALYSKTEDADIPFTATDAGTDTLVTDPNTEFWVWTGMTFIPGGNMTMQSGGTGTTYDGSFHIDNGATFTAQGSEAHAVGGRFVADAGANFTAASSTFTFTATTTGKSITGIAPLTFWNMVWNGTGGNWSINQTLTVGNTFLVNAGTVSGANNVTVYGTSLSGNGTIAMTGGDFTFANGGTFGGGSDWTFGSLTLGNGTLATTTKTGSSTVTVSGVLSVSTAHALLAGTSTTWVLSGGGTPFALSGAFLVENATVRYAALGASANVTPTTYARLEFSATGAALPTYTMGAGAFTIGGPLLIGNATGSAIVLTANTNDPAILAEGDVSVLSGATLVASDIGNFTARRNWTNQGTMTASGGTIVFDATTTGFSVNAGNSSFANVVASSTAGGWTIADHATTTGNFTLAAATSFTLAPGKTLAVGGVFTNAVGGSATTWTNSTLAINSGTTQTINTKSSGSDQYGVLAIGANTQVRMWDSLSATTTLASAASLYSQDHNGASGALFISGAYTHTVGTDYWSYATDFDGATGTARQVNVTIASGTTLSFTAGGLDVLGTPSATTTIDVAGTGSYAWNVSGGTLGMRYYSVRHVDANGLNISGSTAVSDLSDGDFELAVSSGTMIRVAAATIDVNPLLTFQRNRFATSSGVSSGYNVTAVGTSVSAWRFNLSSGNRSGEAFDNDPGGDPGYIIWDDSAAQLVISGNVYSDEGVTPIGGPTCDGVTQSVRLKVQGGGSYTSACNAGTGAYSISGVIFNPKDTLTVYLDTNGGAKAVNIAYDPATNIGNMHLYRDRIIVRNEQGSPVTISSMARYDGTFDTDLPFIATTTATSTTVSAGTGLIVWSSKTFAPGGNVTLHANASGNSWDGTVHLYATSTWSAGGSELYTIGGQFLSETAASVAPANSTFTFTATTTGKRVAASSSLTFYNLAFNGTNGAWDLSGVGTTSNDFTITNGTTTLPSGSLTVGGSFANTGGTFIANGGTIKFTATAGGKTVRANGSSFANLAFEGTGGAWTFTDTNATTTGSFTISAGTPTLPVGTLAVGEHFDNQGGAFVAGDGTLKLTSTSTNRTVRVFGSSLGNLIVSGSGTFLFLDQYATTTGNVSFLSGTTTFPFVGFTVGGSFLNTAAFTAGTSTLSFVATTTGKTVNPGNSLFSTVVFNSAAGGWTISANATTTANCSLLVANSFTLASGKTLEVGGVFTNMVGGAATTWTGNLFLNSGANFTVNTKSLGLDTYNILSLGANTQVRMWGSTSTTVTTDSSAGVYSQNNGGTSGLLYIYGNYTRTSGTDYWSYATDFDGAPLGGSSRQANVRFAANATATYANNAALSMIGSATASTSVDRQASGNYSLILNSATWNAQYYQFRNTGLSGVALLGTTTITSMNNGDFSLDITGGTSLTIASTTIDQNASSQIFTVKFATSSGVTSGYNVTRTGTTTSSIAFNSEYGNFSGEAYDSDGADGCGSIRWSDSACLISDQRAYRFRADDGGEGALASEWYDQSWTKRKRVRITNNTATAVSGLAVKMNVAYENGDMQTGFQDLRFTDSSGTTSIPFWMEASTASVNATVWVKVPQLPASSYADVFMYYGHGTAPYSGVGTTTFQAFDDFEDGFNDYTGNTTLYAQSASIFKTNSYGLAASAGNSTAQNTDGIRKSNVSVGRDTTWHFWQYIDSTKNDEPCFTFGVQSPVTSHGNYSVCLQSYGADHITLAENAVYNARNDGSTQLATTSVTYSTGWYEVFVDHLSVSDRINVSVYTSGGSLFATSTATDSTHTSGSFGFTFWSQRGGWDTIWANPYIATTPSVSFGTEQADSGASWLALENTYLPSYPQNQNVRLRFSVRNSSLATLDLNLRLQVAAKLASPNCESVPTGNYSDIGDTPASCSSALGCMATSSYFTNKASTTQLLSIPTGYTFGQGQILREPYNETDLISLPAAQYTEAEYNFRMSSNASLDRYCLRVVDITTALDNYSRVAEIQVMHPPTISDLTFNGIPTNHIALTEGTTTMITATATVTDLNGWTDLVDASSTYYRSSVAGGSACAPDQNNCYQIATSSCGFSDCTGNTCLLTCATPMYYFADPTDAVSNFASDVWDAFLDVWDTSGAHHTGTANKELYTLSGLAVPSAISYGSVTVGSDTGGNNASTSVANTGNSLLNLNLGGDFLKAGSNLISYSQQKYATSTFTYFGCAICDTLAASSSPSYYSLGVSKATTTTWSPFKDIFWGIGIPPGTAATTFTGFNVFEAMQ